MQIKYTKYFKHWQDFDLLVCILAMIGLVLALVDVSFLYKQFQYENSYSYTKREEDMEAHLAIDPTLTSWDPSGITNESYFVRLIISLTICLAVLALLFRMWLYTYWIDYKDSK